MSACQWLLPLTFALLTASQASQAQGLVFGIVAKSRSDVNFQEVQAGCQQAAEKRGDRCELLGPEGSANARQQYQALDQALNSGSYAAIGLSVTRAEVLAKLASRATIPLITFDSPFPDDLKYLSKAYVGPDNEDIGRVLGELVQKHHPQGGELCIMSAASDTNLDRRVLGLRRQLSNTPSMQPEQRLRGENGWNESLRCPWDNNDDPERTMGQLKTSLQDQSTTAFVSVGAWPIIDPDAYRKVVTPYRQQLVSRTIVITAGMTTPQQRQLVNDGLITELVHIDFRTMGQQLYQLMQTSVTSPENLRNLITPVNIVHPL